MNRRRGLGVFAIVVGVLLFLGMAAGVRRALGGEDVSAFLLVPFLLTGALVCLGVGFHFLWGHRAPPDDPTAPPATPSPDGRPPSP